MASYLLKELYNQVRTVTARKIAVIDENGTPVEGLNDFHEIGEFILDESMSREKASLAVQGQPALRAIPIYSEDKILCLIVCEVVAEDAQTIQIVTSLSQLIVQQFIATNRPKPDAIDLLLTRVIYRPYTIDEQELEEQIAALGYRLDVNRCAMIFEVSGFWENYMQTIGAPVAEKKNLIAAKKNDIERTLSSFFTKNQDNVVGYIGNDRFLVLKDLSNTEFGRFTKLISTHFKDITNTLKNIYIKNVTIGIGSPASSAVDLIQSCQEALQALEVGTKLRGSGDVYRTDVLGILPLVISPNSTHKKEYAERILANLTDEELRQTLNVFLSNNLNLTDTATALKVHRNTVIYRLDKINEEIGRDPRTFEDAVELYLALQLVKIYV